jgi:hypothetical protein
MKFFCSPCKHLLVFLAADSRSTTELEADFLHSQDTRFLDVVLSSTSKLTCFLTVERSGRRRWPLTISSPGAKDSDTSNIASNSKSQDYRKIQIARGQKTLKRRKWWDLPTQLHLVLVTIPPIA